jgi:acyl-CoA thioester hydrolase
LKKPVEFKTSHRVKFSQLDPYQHMNSEHYSSYFLDHRMIGLRENLGWDLKTMITLPFAVYLKRIEVDFMRPAFGDQEIFITSFVREFIGANANIECNMADANGKNISRCVMVAACIDKKTNKPMDWPEETVALFFQNTEN